MKEKEKLKTAETMASAENMTDITSDSERKRDEFGKSEPDLRRIGRKLAYEGTVMQIYQDQMQMPDGRVVQWDYFFHKGGAAVIPVLDDGRILMVRQYRNALDRYTLEIPAGALNEEESGMLCAARELEEETGYRSDNLTFLVQSNSMPAFSNEKVAIYVAKDLKPGKQHLDEQEFLQVEVWKLQDLIAKIYAGTLTDSKTVCGLLAYQVQLLQQEQQTR